MRPGCTRQHTDLDGGVASCLVLDQGVPELHEPWELTCVMTDRTYSLPVGMACWNRPPVRDVADTSLVAEVVRGCDAPSIY